jgi:hypothetical protein
LPEVFLAVSPDGKAFLVRFRWMRVRVGSLGAWDTLILDLVPNCPQGNLAKFPSQHFWANILSQVNNPPAIRVMNPDRILAVYLV